MKDITFSSGDSLFVLDGYGYVFRAYHALPPLTRKSDHLPIGAVAGFCNMLFPILLEGSQKKSFATETVHTLGCVALDAPGRTFRQDIYPDYKANRKETPEDLKVQLPLIRDAVKAFGLHVIEQQGYEADDVMASLANKARYNDVPLTLVSSDKDLMQLIGGSVTMYDPVKSKRVGIEQVYEKFGVSPENVTDVQALIGDSSDNIPGVPGIGVKTAALLIQEFGTLDNVLENCESLPQKKRRELLRQYQEQARLSKTLATLKDDLVLPIDKHDLRLGSPDMQALAEFFYRMEFNTLSKRAIKAYGEPFNQAWLKVSEQRQSYHLINDTDVPHKKTHQQEDHSVFQIQTPQTRYQKELERIQAIAFDTKAYQCVTDKKVLHTIIETIKQQDVIAMDTETTGLDPMKDELVGISLSWTIGEAYYIPLQHRKDSAEVDEKGQGSLYYQHSDQYVAGQLDVEYVIKQLQEILNKTNVMIVGHNIKFDLVVLQRYGLILRNIHDTMLMSYALHAGKHGHSMDYLAQTYLLYKPMSFKDVVGSGKSKKNFSQIDIDIATQYAAEDADVTLRLYQCFFLKLVAEKKCEVYRNLECSLIPVLVSMESAGIQISSRFLNELSQDFYKKLHLYEQKIFALAGEDFNIASPKQLGYILFEKLGIHNDKKTRTGHAATGAAVLERLAVEGHDIAKDILEWRHYAKLISTYTDTLPLHVNTKTHRVHTNYSLAATTTGRLASTQPNLQNIPMRTEEGRSIRKAFIAPSGYVFVGADYSQIELRLFAHIAQIDTLVKAFHEGKDIHAMIASELFNLPVEDMDPLIRRRAKAINFGIIYGISAFGLAAQLGISQQKAKEYLHMYLERFAGIKRYMENTAKYAQEKGYVETIFGRRCYYPLMQSGTAAQKQLYKRAAINAPIQGSAADIIRRAMIRLPSMIEEHAIEARLLLQVHDELLFEVKQDHAEKLSCIVKDVMEKAHLPKITLSVPLVVDVKQGRDWQEAH